MGVAAAAAIAGGIGTAIHSLPKHGVSIWKGAPAKPGPVVAIDESRVPDRYRVTYQVDTGHPLGSSRSTQELSVNRPFESRLITRDARGKHELLNDETTALGRQKIASTGQSPQIFALPADLAGTDVRLDVALSALIAEGRVVERERRAVLGRPCQVYRSSGPLASGSLTKPTAKDFTDSCVDAAGLVLAEVQRSGGKVTRQEVATAVDEHPTFDTGLFTAGEPTIPGSRGGGTFKAVDPTLGPSGRAYALDTPPAGFTFLGRYVDVSGTKTDAFGAPSPTRRAGFSDVWVRGRDVVILDQGGVNVGPAPFTPDPSGQPVDLGLLGSGQTITSTRLQVVRSLVAGGGNGAYVRVAGTIPVDQLAALARSLRVIPAPPGG